EEEEEDDGD
ncbi:hypothetical protein CFC21_073627, partial [Triticum aestivum]